MKLKKVLFILSGNLTTTPRAVKVIKMLSESGFECDVVLVSRQFEWEKKDRQIIENHSLNSVNLQLGRRPFFPWLKTTIQQKLSALMYKISKENIDLTAYASNKSSIILWQYVKNGDYSGYMGILGHGAGSLYPSIKLGQKWNVPVMFDVEDYHPGEFIGKDSVDEKQRRESLIKKLLPKAMAITYASPLIGKYTLNLVGEKNIDRHLLINNSFYSNEFELQKDGTKALNANNSVKLKLVWFSQYIDAGRGLEHILPTLDRLQDQLELHLIGNLRNSYAKDQLEGRNYIKLHKALSQTELHSRLSEFDVGLALEDNSKDLNRDLCLTNKIWAYAQAGLCIMATSTQAQRQFMEDYPWSGNVFDDAEKDLSSKLRWIINNLEHMRSQKQNRFQQAKKNMGWEHEGSKLIKMISKMYD